MPNVLLASAAGHGEQGLILAALAFVLVGAKLLGALVERVDEALRARLEQRVHEGGAVGEVVVDGAHGDAQGVRQLQGGAGHPRSEERRGGQER